MNSECEEAPAVHANKGWERDKKRSRKSVREREKEREIAAILQKLF